MLNKWQQQFKKTLLVTIISHKELILYKGSRNYTLYLSVVEMHD